MNIAEFKEKYHGRKLSTDEYAEARNTLIKAVDEIDSIEFNPSGPDSLTLKWGTLKSWNFEQNEKAQELFSKYNEAGMRASAMLQKDTDEQKRIICEIIEIVDGEIYADWDGKFLTKEQAKKYVMDY